MRVVIERIGITVLIWGSLFFHVHANTAENILLNEVRQGELLLKADHPGQYTSAVMGATDVDIVITGAIARVRVTQYFNNPHPQWMEGTYAFPLPDQSAVDQMNMVIGDRLIKGVIKEKQEARKSYDQAKQAGKSASIIEQISPNIFTTAVANIPPEGEVRVEIEYQQKLSWRDGAFSINFPTAITPRYLPQELINRGEQREIHALNQEWTLLPLAITDHESDYGNSGETLSAEEYPLKTSDSVKNRTPPTNITIKLNAGFPLAQLFSRYHPVSVNRVLNGDGTVTQVVRLDASNHTSKHDFELVWLPKAGNAPQAVFFTEQHGEEQYGLLMVMPPSLKHETQSPPREVTFVIDTSGSMDGPSIAQAKSALRSALARLEAEDSFNIIAFNSESSALLGQPLAATPEALHIADYFISKLEAGGGTEMMGALKMALANPGLGKKEETRKRRLQQVVFITDGAVGNEAELFRYVHNHLGDRRLFTVGIGSAPNSYFMRKSAQFGRGSYTVIGDIKEVGEKMNQLFNKMEQVVLSDLTLKLEGVAQDQVILHPEKLSDLYRGEPIIVSMKMGAMPTKAVLRGNFNDAPWSQEIGLKGSAEQSGVGVLFGRKAIESWMDQHAIGGDKAEVRNAIIALAYRYHLVSQYTSLVAVDMTAADPLKENNRPREEKIRPQGKRLVLAQTATTSEIQMIFGLLLTLISLLLFWHNQRKSQPPLPCLPHGRG